MKSFAGATSGVDQSSSLGKMLKQLTIEDYAIIESLSVDFTDGLNVFTGETGAGKSIIVGALGLALGERVTDEIIRKDKDVCTVEAVFDLKKSSDKFSDFSCVDPCNEIRIRREFRRNGRSRCWINGRQVSLNLVKRIGNLLVDFHGQHEHQRLLQVSNHADFLDAFAGLCELRRKFSALRREAQETRRRILDMEKQIEEMTRNEHLIAHDIEEIENLSVTADEDVNLQRQIRLLEHGEKIIANGMAILDDLYEGQGSALSKLASAIALIEEIATYSPEMGGLSESLEEAQVIIKDVAESLRDKVARIDLDASQLDALRQRLASIERLKRKYGKSLQELIAYFESLKSHLSGKEDLEQQISELKTNLGELEHKLGNVCLELRRKRKAAAKRFESLVEQELKSLGIPGARFRVVIDEIDDGETITLGEGRIITIGETGADYVEFFIRTNVGEQLLPLRRIASGGEISRVMLALKKLLAGADEIETLVFDEIDSGIGGSLAETVGSKLAELARCHQVICITHLPQIAAAGKTHFSVEKKIDKRRTVTHVRMLDDDGRISELARMIGGRKPPRSARVHAETILRRGGK